MKRDQKKLAEMVSWSLDQKIEHAKKRIREFHEAVDGKTFVSFSGGKDSTVLLHLVRSVYPDTPAVFFNTTNEFHEILEFVRSVENVEWLMPKMTFNETVEKEGFPLISKMNAVKIRRLRTQDESCSTSQLYLTGYTSNGKFSPRSKLPEKWKRFIDAPFDVTEKCCDILKKNPVKEYERRTKRFAYIGTMASEAESRKKSWLDHGCNVFSDQRKQSRPMSIWTEEDVWEYIRRFNVPYASIYDDVYDEDGNKIICGEKRTGCAFCAYGLHLEKPDELGMTRFERLKKRKPGQFKRMMKLKNNGVSFEEALEFYLGKKEKNLFDE